jgi:hypothetical protein
MRTSRWSRSRLAIAPAALLAGAGCRASPGPAAPPPVEPGPGARDLAVTSTPAGAEVFTGGRARGRTPVRVRLDPGRHHLVLRLPGYLPFETDVSVGPDADGSVDAQLVSSH